MTEFSCKVTSADKEISTWCGFVQSLVKLRSWFASHPYFAHLSFIVGTEDTPVACIAVSFSSRKIDKLCFGNMASLSAHLSPC